MKLLSLILYNLGRVRYAFVKRLRIAKIFFDSLSTCDAKDDIN